MFTLDSPFPLANGLQSASVLLVAFMMIQGESEVCVFLNISSLCMMQRSKIPRALSSTGLASRCFKRLLQRTVSGSSWCSLKMEYQTSCWRCCPRCTNLGTCCKKVWYCTFMKKFLMGWCPKTLSGECQNIVNRDAFPMRVAVDPEFGGSRERSDCVWLLVASDWRCTS